MAEGRDEELTAHATGVSPALRAQGMKMRHCFYCGDELGVYADHDPLDTCGKAACNRAASDAAQEEREEAHERLDRDMGWGR
jgi:hypothetical protein